MRIAVIDAQGAGLGKAIIERLRRDFGSKINITALATNAHAGENMLQAGANESIVGEEAIIGFCQSVSIHCIIGPIGIICSGGIQGEISSGISETIFRMDCTKYIIPLQKHGIYIPGTRNLKIKEIIQEIIYDIKGKMWIK